MSTLETAVATALVLAAAIAAAQESPGLGQPVNAAEIAAWDLSIGPDGAGLPPGSGTGRAGAAVYAAKCMVCHGAEGAGQPHDRLAGGQGTLRDPVPVKTVGSYWPYATTIFDYVRRAMPLTQPQSLSDDEVYAVTAYLLAINGIIDDSTVINAKTLPRVEMPNRDNFVWAYKAP
jgi:S-disulfanyl-L-cysteine oxidoreductase SoxD